MPPPGARASDTGVVDECCAPRTPDGYEREFDARFASNLARRYRRKGPTPTAQRILDFAASHGLEGASVLEVGGGIGEIQLELLKRGAARTTNLELSGAYETEAARLIDEARLGGRVTRMVGVDLAVSPDDVVEPADIVVLNRVVCCYPDYERLLGAAARHARHAVIFSHPPRTAFTRVALWLDNLAYRLTRRTYRGFVHPPDAMVGVLARNGIDVRYRHRGRVWCVVGAVRA